MDNNKLVNWRKFLPKKLNYSTDLISIEEDNGIDKIFYDGQYLASMKTIYNDTESSVSNILFDINKEYDLIGFFNKSITHIILASFAYPIKELIFENFPITHRAFNDIFNKIRETYDDKINIVNFELDSMKCIKRIVIQIQLPKNTHYIQQAYLRKFSSNSEIWKQRNRKDKARIYVFNKYKNSIETIGNTPKELKYGQKIKSIAKDNEFYSLAMEQIMRRVYEKFVPPIFDKLIKNPKLANVTKAEKEIIVDYIILTWGRTKECRKAIKEMYLKTVRIFAEDYKGKKLPNVTIEMDPQFLRKFHEDHMMSFLAPFSNEHKKLSHLLLNLHWKIIKTKFPSTFLTSDNPVVFFNSYYDKEKEKGNDYMSRQIENFKNYMDFENWEGFVEIRGKFGRAIANKGVEIYLPISPQICICLYDTEITKTLLTPSKINREIILQADEHIFSHHNRLNFIKKIIIKNPDCVDRDGNRQEVRASFKNILKHIES